MVTTRKKFLAAKDQTMKKKNVLANVINTDVLIIIGGGHLVRIFILLTESIKDQ